MTPFGEKMRAMRAARGVTLTEMAQAVLVTPTYLSALERGRRGRPSWLLLQRIIAYFNVIWDEAEELQRLAGLSHPRVVVDTEGLSARATRVANRMAERIHRLDDATLAEIERLIDQAAR
jgi:transcriptional regulator with XRE-family HTH domain